MKITQRGCLPLTILILMGLFVLCILSFSVYVMFGFITEGYIQRVAWDRLTFSWFVTRIMPILFFVFANLYIGVIALSFFPYISLTNSGLDVRSLLSKTTINWDEIEGVKYQKLPKGIILVLNRGISNIFHTKFPLINYIYGFLFGIFKPIIFISQDSDAYSQVLNRLKINGVNQI